MIAQLQILGELYARVYEKVILHTCSGNGDHPTKRDSAVVGVALAREEADHAVEHVCVQVGALIVRMNEEHRCGPSSIGGDQG